MRWAQIGALALASEAAYGYIDTSPFFMSSTSELLLPSHHIQSGSSLTSDLLSALSSCPSNFYLFAKQQGVSGSDFSTPESAPALSRLLNGGKHSSRFSAITPEVLGSIDTRLLEEQLSSRCGARIITADTSALPSSFAIDGSTQLLSIDFPAPSKSQPERAADILSNDQSLSPLLDLLHGRNYTLIYTSTSPETASEPATPYRIQNNDDYSGYDFFHTELKRDLPAGAATAQLKSRQSSTNQTMIDGPLFEKYQFLTPGLFTALAVSVLLLGILYVAISGLAGLEVSYAAFDKENGPAGAQRKAR